MAESEPQDARLEKEGSRSITLKDPNGHREMLVSPIPELRGVRPASHRPTIVESSVVFVTGRPSINMLMGPITDPGYQSQTSPERKK